MINIVNKFKSTEDEMDRFFITREYFDNVDERNANLDFILLSLKDGSELIRSEGADFIIVYDNIDPSIIIHILENECYILVYTKLRLALSLKSRGLARSYFSKTDIFEISLFEKPIFTPQCMKYQNVQFTFMSFVQLRSLKT